MNNTEEIFESILNEEENTKHMSESLENGEWDEDAMNRATELISEASGTLEELKTLYEKTGCYGDANGIEEALDILEKIAIGEY